MLHLKSYAKINIGLEVLYKRQDGFHEINTIFSKIGLYDEITIEPNIELIVECNPPLNLHPEQNLAYKSGKLIQNYFATKSKGAKITIFKKIPLGGGLGGGSSNAATVLKGLCNFWGIKATETEIQNMAAELGADVPFFLGGYFAVGKGKGELLKYFDFKIPYHILLVLPDISVDTGTAYRELQRGEELIKGTDLKKVFLENINKPLKLRELLKNDFECTVFKKFPEIAQIKEKLYENGAVFAQMSGSGSSIYGFYNSLEELMASSEELNSFGKTISLPINEMVINQ